jgi:hypothetical protein
MPLIAVGDLIDRSWEHYRKEFRDLIAVSGWILLVALMDVTALAIYPSASKIIGDSALSTQETLGVGLYAFANWMLAPIIGLWTFVALVRLVRSQLSGESNGLAAAARDGVRMFFPALLVSALVILVLFGAVAAGFAPALALTIAASYVQNNALAVLAGLSLIVGTIVAIVLGLSWSVRSYFAPYALLMDGKRGRASVSASRAMVNGRFWPVLIRLVVPKLVFIMLGILAASVVSFVYSLATGAFAGMNLDVQLRLSTISTSVLSALAAALLNPLIVTADVMLYQSMKR